MTFPAHSLIDFLADAASRRPHHAAAEDSLGKSSYAELDALSDRVRDRLHALGVRKGHRVGIYMEKSIDAYAIILGALKAGAAYVPVDRGAPAWRAASITHDCALEILALERDLLEEWATEATKLGPRPRLFELDAVGGGDALRSALDRADEAGGAPPVSTEPLTGEDLAYVLYTSGSTGSPKGVMLTHEAAISFVGWCVETFSLRGEDRFSSHAPLHFDLSILDLYVPLKLGGTVVLIDAARGKEPRGLAQLIADRRLTVWYSTPTTLMMLAQFGRLDRHDLSALRYVFFAGEVFPVKHLHAIKQLLPGARFVNLYGPTETNVCTWHPIPTDVDARRAEPYPIGKACSHFTARAIDAEGRDVEPGVRGELIVHGRGTMRGYWNLPEQSEAAFLVDAQSRRWYRTGDIVIEQPDGSYVFAGRRDRMVKRRGYRIELGDIEAALYRHAGVAEAAAVAQRDAEGAVRIKAFLVLADGEAASEIQIRQFCARTLPSHMIPDAFGFLDRLPMTSTGKVDHRALARNP